MALTPGEGNHLFTECETWRPQIRRLRRRVGKDCGWKHPRAPAVRKLWREEATEAVLKFLRDTRVGCWTASRGAGRPAEADQDDGGKRAVRGRLRDVISSLFRGCGRLLVVRRYVQVILYRLFFSFPFPLSFVFLSPFLLGSRRGC